MKITKTTEKTLRDAVMDVLDKDIRSINTHLIDLQSVSSFIVTISGDPTEFFISNIEDLRELNHEATIILGDDIETSEEDFIAMVESGEITITVDPDVLELDGVKITPLKTAGSTTIDIEWTTYHLAAQYVIETGPSSLTIISSLKYCPIDEYSYLRIMNNYGEYVDELVKTGEIVVTSDFSDLEIDTSDEYVRILQRESDVFDEITITARDEKWKISGEFKLMSVPNGLDIILENASELESLYPQTTYELIFSLSNPSYSVTRFIRENLIRISSTSIFYSIYIEDGKVFLVTGEELVNMISVSWGWSNYDEKYSHYFEIIEKPFEGIYMLAPEKEHPDRIDYICQAEAWGTYECYGMLGYQLTGTSYKSSYPFVFTQSSEKDIDYLMSIQDDDSLYGIEFMSLEEAASYANEGTLDDVMKFIKNTRVNIYEEIRSNTTTTYQSNRNTESGGTDVSGFNGVYVIQYTYDGKTWEDMSILLRETNSSSRYFYSAFSITKFSYELVEDEYYIDITSGLSGTAVITGIKGNANGAKIFAEIDPDGRQVLGVRILAIQYVTEDSIKEVNPVTITQSEMMGVHPKYRTPNHVCVDIFYIWSKYNVNGEIDENNTITISTSHDNVYATYNQTRDMVEAAQGQPFIYFNKEIIPDEEPDEEGE